MIRDRFFIYKFTKKNKKFSEEFKSVTSIIIYSLLKLLFYRGRQSGDNKLIGMIN